MKLHHLTQVAALLFTLAMTADAIAQYVWLDEHGVKQFSDVAPPSNVPEKRILKQPRGDAAEATTSTPASAASTAAESANAPMSLSEKNTEFNKRREENAEKQKKAEEESRRSEAKAENCARANSYLKSLKSDTPVVTTNDNGEQVTLDNEERAKEMGKTQELVEGCR